MTAMWDILVWLAPYVLTAYVVLVVLIVGVVILAAHLERTHGPLAEVVRLQDRRRGDRW